MSDLQIIPEKHPDSFSHKLKRVPINKFIDKPQFQKEQLPTTPQKEIIPLHTSKEQNNQVVQKSELLQNNNIVPKSGELALVNPNKIIGGQQSTTVSQVLSKIAGYQSAQTGVSQSFVNDPKFPQNIINFTKSAQSNNSSLWQATLLLKVYQSWQSFF